MTGDGVGPEGSAREIVTFWSSEREATGSIYGCSVMAGGGVGVEQRRKRARRRREDADSSDREQSRLVMPVVRGSGEGSKSTGEGASL